MARSAQIAKSAWWMQAQSFDDQLHYMALRDFIARQIEAGHQSLGSRLPSERQLQSGLGAARGTIRAALMQLEAEGIIYRRDRSGWYVSPPPVIYDPTKWEGFMSYVAAQGRVPATETLGVNRVLAPEDVAEIFGLEARSELYEIRRRRFIDGRAVLVETIFVNPSMAPGLDDHDLNGSLTHVLRHHYGISVATNKVEMQPCALSQSIAADLGIKAGPPGLSIRRISLDKKGQVVEYDHEFWRHDAMRIRVESRV